MIKRYGNQDGKVKLQAIATVVGIIVGLLSALYTATNLYEKWKIGGQSEKFNEIIILANKKPLISEALEIRPKTKAAVKIDMSFKVYETGDIIIESGSMRQFLPFDSYYRLTSADWFAEAAYAQERVIDGVTYRVQTLKYIESAAKIDDNLFEERKVFENGTEEIKVIDIKSNKIIETRQSKVTLTTEQKQEISRSEFSKQILTAVTGTGQ